MGLVQSAYVIGRRDFVATVMSKTFLLFLLGPLIPMAFGIFFASMGASIGPQDRHPQVAVIAGATEFQVIKVAHKRLSERFTKKTLPDLVRAEPDYVPEAQIRDLLAANNPKVLAVLSGGVERPKLTGAISEDGSIRKYMGLILDEARQLQALQRANLHFAPTSVTIESVEESAAALASARSATAAMSQSLLFVLTMLLATLLLSNLVEEKSNKIIEMLAAAVPVDAIFLGKLFAMLAISFVGIAVWASVGVAAAGIWLKGNIFIPEPAVGWGAFILMIFVYYAASYLLLGGLLLGIGGQASSIREIQTVSMPVTMGQLAVFALAIFSVGQYDHPIGWVAATFPFSSPFAMLARGAERPELWPHLLAILWQALWVWLIVRLSAGFFRRSVLKSGCGVSARGVAA
ncbi:MAG TPA: ABC transporter permease [Allosphingosinicella sp.]|nr:ABC transporter permease [Allosphingosinicella sp.]